MPACIGPWPATSCRYCEMKNRKPTSEKMLSRLASTEPVKALCRNNRTSSIGCGRLSWRRTNSAPAASPTITMPTAVGERPCLAMLLIA